MANFYTAIRDTIAAYGWTGTDAEILALGNEPYYAAGDGTKTAVPSYRDIVPSNGVGELEMATVATELDDYCTAEKPKDPRDNLQTYKAADAFGRMMTAASRVEEIEYTLADRRALLDGMMDLLVAETRIPSFDADLRTRLQGLGTFQETVWVRTCSKTPTEADIKYARTLPAAQKVA